SSSAPTARWLPKDLIGPGWRSLVGGPFCPRARYVRSGDNDRNRLACYEKKWLLFSSTASNHRSWTKATWKRILVKKLHYIFGVPAPGSPAKPLQDYIVLKEIAADCRRWVRGTFSNVLTLKICKMLCNL